MIRRLFKFTGLALAALILVLIVAVVGIWGSFKLDSRSNLASFGDEAASLQTNGFAYRDLNKNGALDVYEDSRQPVEERVDDLMSQMTLAEKAGVMFITFTPAGIDGELVEGPTFSNPVSFLFAPNSELIAAKMMNHFSIGNEVVDAAKFARWHNTIQKLAERTRLGIPITLATDPRNAVGTGGGVALPAGEFSKWPDALGLAATRDAGLVQQFANIARQEYRAVGFHLALHPTADLATEPRWARNASTFGEDANLAAELVSAYVTGFQGEELGGQSVAAMVKHFSGGGPQMDGEDAHFAYGREQVYPGNNFDYHIIPFEQGAFPAGASQVMPYYGIPMGQTDEDVGFAYNKQIITGLLREKYQFDGVICTDWGLISDAKMFGVYTVLPARAWGVEDLTEEERMLKLIDAGNDQFGGEQIPEMLVELVKAGKVSEARIDQSVRRILLDKFKLGLFDNPYVDEANATGIAGRADFLAAGVEAQRKSLTLLKNGDEAAVLPMQSLPKIYIENIDPVIAAKYGSVVEKPEDADFAIIRIDAPFEEREGLFESLMHAGDLDFKGEERARLIKLLDTVPTVVDIYLDRPAVIPEIADKSAALIGSFGANDAVLLDMIFGNFAPTGKLPIELPSSMEAVNEQQEDLPYDSANPLFAFGHGLTYGQAEDVEAPQAEATE